MLITFRTEAYGSITFFGHVAQRLLHYMGQSGRVPGAIVAKDVAHALALLSQALDQEAKPSKPASPPEMSQDEEPEISLAQRAIPLIALLQAAVDQHCDVLWA